MISAKPGSLATPAGDLVLRRWLAQGGMAELYLASPADPRRASEVMVVKRVLPQFSNRGSFVSMFAREARLASMLRHPNIVEVHDAEGLGAEDCFFTMEYIHGIDLGELLETLKNRNGLVPLAHALTIAVSMCAGLHYAHEATDDHGQPVGIVHRDVSPSNVLLGFDGAIKITDFGVAKALAMTRLTEEGTRKGKLAYMSPEQATGETVDRRADVFAIGSVLYEMTTMVRLFGGDNDLAVMHNILHRPRPSPTTHSPSYPAALEAIVMKTVAKDIDQRYPTARALQADLERFAQDVGLVLDPAAVGAFVRTTMPVPVHPAEDPEFATSVIVRYGPARPVGTPRPADASPPASTSIYAEDRSSAPAPPDERAGATGPSPAGATVVLSPSPAAIDPPSDLHRTSLVLAALALLVAVGVGVGLLAWQSARPPAPRPSPDAVTVPTVPAAAPAPSSTDEPAPAAPSTDEPAPSQPTTPAPASAGELDPPAEPLADPEPAVEARTEPGPRAHRPRRRKLRKRTPAPPPNPEPKPASKKRPVTDTLLPIRE